MVQVVSVSRDAEESDVSEGRDEWRYPPGPIDGEFSTETMKAMCAGRVPELSAFPEIYDLAATLVGKDPNGTLMPTDEEKMLPYRSARGGWTVDLDNVTTLVYMRIWKNANDNMECFGRALHSVLKSKSKYNYAGMNGGMELQAVKARKQGKSPLMFTLIREPLGHYKSAYNEVLFRRQNVVTDPVQKCYTPGFDDLAHNSTEKFREFVRQLFSSGLEHMGGCWGIGGGYAHAYPQTNVLGFKDPDPRDVLFQHIKYAETIPQVLRSHFNLSRAQLPMDKVNRTCGQHESSGDPLGSYAAARAAAADPDDPVVDAVCLLLIYDYACFPEYYVPESRCKRAYDRHREALQRIIEPHISPAKNGTSRQM